MASDALSRSVRATVGAGVCFLVAWQAAALAGAPRRALVALGLYGFVLHVVFGKAYSLVPSYFDRDLAWQRAPAAGAPLTAGGALALAVAPLAGVPDSLAAAGAVAWGLGALLFLGTVAWTVRDNPLGTETGTGEHNADREAADRAANRFVPLVFAYLLLGAWETAAAFAPLPSLLGAYPPRATHLLAAGVGALTLFSVGFRLLPRFLVSPSPGRLAWVVLPAGAAGPLLIAVGLPAGALFRAGAALEAVAVAAFAAAYLRLFRRARRDRVGFLGPLLGCAAGLAGVCVGLWFAVAGLDAGLALAHLRLNLLGFLGLTIVGVLYQFYPPTAAEFRGGGPRLARASLAALALGLALEASGLALGARPAVVAGRGVGLLGALAVAYLVFGLFVQRARG